MAMRRREIRWIRSAWMLGGLVAVSASATPAPAQPVRTAVDEVPAGAASGVGSAIVDRVEVTSRSLVQVAPAQFAGAVQVLDRAAMESRQPLTILEALRELPGLTVVPEDAAGTHLNIGVRGLNPRRSSRVLLLEDGAPTPFFAPYADPSSHYSTPLDRVERIELVKGAGQVLYGPQSLGGMLNFITRAVPRAGLEARGHVAVGNQGIRHLSAALGYGSAQGGWLLDLAERTADGVRQEHGARVTDVALKTEWRPGNGHRLTGKWARFQERSRFSETGLTAPEFATQPRGVPTTAGERFDMERDTAQVVHQWTLNPQVELHTQAYSSTVFRQSTRLREFEPEDPSLGIGALEIDPAIRPRRYVVRGLEPRLSLQHAVGGAAGQLIVGARHHTERVDRQKFLTEGLAGPIAEADERLKVDVQARAVYVQNVSSWGSWSFSQGLRWESIRMDKQLFLADDAQPAQFSAQAVSALRNHGRQTLPSLGLNWNGWRDTTVFAGVHKGFAPPRPDRDVVDTQLQKVQPELATIAELGIRSRAVPGVRWGATVYDMKIHDIVVQAGGVFRNEGEARHTGLEWDAQIDLGHWLQGRPGPLTLSVAYGYLHTAKFLGSGTVGGEGEDGYGSYAAGNRLPYAPKHSLTVSTRWAITPALAARLGWTHTSHQVANTEGYAQTSVAGYCPAGEQPADGLFCGLYGGIPPRTLMNANLQYAPRGAAWSTYLAVENATDQRGIASRTNGLQGLRGRAITVGLRWAL